MHKFTRTKRLILTVLAGAVLTAGAAAPTVHAADGGTQTVDNATCEQWQGWFVRDMLEAAIALGDHRTGVFFDELGEAKYVLEMAKKAGCAWAQNAPRVNPDSIRPLTETMGGSVGIAPPSLSLAR